MRTHVGGAGQSDDFELVGIAENGEKALSAVNELRPDVLIIELMLPVMDGMSVLSRLHEQDGPHPAVMVFSAFASPQIGAECAALGVDLFLRKPMEPQAVCRAASPVADRSAARGQGRGKHGA